MIGRDRATALLASALFWLPAQALAQECVNIFHDEAAQVDQGSINAIFLANLLGHWPQYEVRARPISEYQKGAVEACKATFYVGTAVETSVPKPFLEEFFTTQKSVAWVGFGAQQLDQQLFSRTFGYTVVGELGVDDENADEPSFFQFVTYKGSVFVKDMAVTEQGWEADSPAADLKLAEGQQDRAKTSVLAELVHSRTGERKPYFLRDGRRFFVGDVPFAYMHEGGRYFAFADLLFDVLEEKPRREEKLAFARVEDIHGLYDIDLLKATFATLSSEGVPISIAHIPLYMDPYNSEGYGVIDVPKPSNQVPEFVALVKALEADKRNAVIWHGTTHQRDKLRNPSSGVSGDDYEFWDAAADRPLQQDSVEATVARLREGLPVLESYGLAPRYWVTPHYQASALNSRVFGAVFPWSVGRVTYYPTSVGPSFTLPAAGQDSASLASVTADKLRQVNKLPWPNLDMRSEGGLGQLFPFEIYRDLYGQRVIPETLNYLSVTPSERGPGSRDVGQFLADAQRNLVIRDYWASFFFHPYIFQAEQDDGAGRYFGDTQRLRELIIGLKGMGYRFTGLPEFEASLSGQLSN